MTMTGSMEAEREISSGGHADASRRAAEVEQRGFAIVRDVLPGTILDEFDGVLGVITGAGERGMLARPEVGELAVSDLLVNLVRPHLPSTPRPVRAIYFDKNPGTNWLVAWHQDLTIAVASQIEVPGFGPWSRKGGVLHVQPPVEVLENMITVRLHWDDADETNGALRVLPGSHRRGRLAAPEIEQCREEVPEVACCANRGDALLMRPLLLHASGRSVSERRRRVLHIEYAAGDLPQGLAWNSAA